MQSTIAKVIPTILMPIKENYARLILSGEKKWELRRRAPLIEPPYRVILVVSGTGGKIPGEFICDNVCKLTPRQAKDIIGECGITMPQFYEYLGGKKHLNFLHVSAPKSYDEASDAHPTSIHELGYSRTPQSWVYLD